ncbi:hypothetical protein [Nitratidesulfovibrio vulgaris]|jgi:hypothetical protein|uniref:Lipoprotein n=1 Tax=Nitratidesulfovibrio vulgaris (strain ATCC 29579 / DSM 644 / CCUG 34227 / NCIMB 8303 / VKM B-1760 / Hildenborough) TaxID=882 RepID=Q72AY7_NITV2|nr:hypothetical protein [Nitratidesulfovibrio vulgaris]AAS96329.1 hypothetical protein DVU_1853 [Nitratidesulfovibrio vulgaris str. Hildenborough]ADP86607.1 hypothetical protein Deval_1452 [Nitratidesulfovibrio vulgaris RCH1]WCB45338.1 UBX domain-containing protein 8 [Nitratidesulfovibrio vulgaris]HBW16440.1 UBX domain-containing protein 8 [Desulfovibrio sp.]
MRLLLALLVGGCLLLAQLPAHAEGSLLPSGEYPEADCRSPLRPLAGDRHSEWMHYRNEMLRYRACVEAYVRTAREDMQRIQRQVDRAVRDYNREAGMP